MVNSVVLWSCIFLSNAARIKHDEDEDGGILLEETLSNCPAGQESCYVWNTYQTGDLTCYNPTTHQCVRREHVYAPGPYHVCQVGEILCGHQCSNEVTGVCCGEQWYPHSDGQKQCCTGRCSRGCESWACDVAETCLSPSDSDFDGSVFMTGEVGGLGRCDRPATGMGCLLTVIPQSQEWYFTSSAPILIPLGGCTPDGTGLSYSALLSDTDGFCFPHGTDFSRGCGSVTDCDIRVKIHGDAHCTTNYNTHLCHVSGPSDQCTLTTETECAKSLFDAGWDCHGDVMWAKTVGIDQHPEWYGSLTSSSSISDIHAYIHALPACSPEQPPPCAPHYCTRPCYSSQEVDVCWVGVTGFGGDSILNVCRADGHGGSNIVGTLSDLMRDSPCPNPGGVIWVRHFPNPFCTGDHDESFSAFMDGMERENCCNQDASRCDLTCKAYIHEGVCQNLAPDENTVCADEMRWAMTEGIRSHPSWYPGLSVHSSPQEFQLYLSGLPLCADNGSVPPCYGGETRCPTPCTNA